MSQHPIVTIAEKQYTVPKLVPRQLRIVQPALMRFMPLLSDPTKLTTALYDDLISVLFWGAVWPNDKSANPACLMDVHIPFDEMLAAIKVIRNQSGLFKEVASSEGAQPGEAQESQSIGT